MNDIVFCKGSEDHIEVTETESKAWHDYDLYTVVCLKCGARETRVLARRPTQVLLRCVEEGDK